MEKTSKGNGLLWTGLAMIGAALILAVVGSLYAGRARVYSGPGGMMWSGGMMGQGYGAPGWGSQGGGVGSLSDARDAVERAVQSYGNPDLRVGEVMEFANNYYAEIEERDTNTLAMELLVDKRTGQVYPEPGPNMMWNTKYGMMAGGMGSMMGAGGSGMMGNPSQANPRQPMDEMPIGPDRATDIANDYLERVSPGTETEKPDTFYGYYTLHTERDGKVTGMLSVNGYSGEVWYHSWHGAFVAMDEGEASH